MNKLLEKARRSYILNLILERLGGPSNGLGKAMIRLLYLYYSFFPYKEKSDAREYFSAHGKDVQNNLDLLADEKSREIYSNIIKFRTTMNYRYHPRMETPQYFIKDIIEVGEEEVFLDVGGYAGSSSADFIEYCDHKYKKIVIFEPDEMCIRLINENKRLDKDRYVLINKGVWDKECMIGFEKTGKSDSRVVENYDGGGMISVTSLDLCSECQDATFIKMDIEGSEMKALMGAEKLIKKNKPKLAICIYHSNEDMIRIISYVHDLVPEYRIYVRHHSAGTNETVAYFV